MIIKDFFLVSDVVPVQNVFFLRFGAYFDHQNTIALYGLGMIATLEVARPRDIYQTTHLICNLVDRIEKRL